MFNLCHSSLYNIVERIFEVIKRHFQIFKSAPEYHYNTQISPVFAVTALHNVIRMYQLEEDIYNTEQWELDEGLDDDEESVETRANLAKRDRRKMNEFCNRIENYGKTIYKNNSLEIHRLLRLSKSIKSNFISLE